MLFTKKLANIPVLVLLLTLITQVQNWVQKIGNPVNTNIQTGEMTLFSTPLTLGSISYYTINYPTSMSTTVLEGAVGIVGLEYIIERKHGFTIFIVQINQASMDLQVLDNYNVSSPSLNVCYMKIRYIVSSHPNVDIDYA